MDPSPTPGQPRQPPVRGPARDRGVLRRRRPERVPRAAQRPRAPRHVGRAAALPRRRSRLSARPARSCASTFRRRRADRRRVRRLDGHAVGGARRPAVVAHRSGTRRTSTSRRASARSRRRRTSPFIIPCNTFTQIASRVPFDAASTATRPRCSRARSMPAPGRPAARHRALPDERPLRRRGRRAVQRDRARPLAQNGALDARRVALALPAGLDGDRQRRPRAVGPTSDGDGDVHGHAAPRRRAAGRASRSARRSPPTQGTRHDRPRRPRRPGRAGTRAAAAAGRAVRARGRATPACRSSAASSSRCCRSASARPARCASTCTTGAARRSPGTVSLTAAGRLLGDARVAAVLRPRRRAPTRRSPSHVTNTDTALPTANAGRRRTATTTTQVTTTSGARRRAARRSALELVPVDDDPAGGRRPGRGRRRGRGRVPRPGARPQPALGGRRRARRPPTARARRRSRGTATTSTSLVHVTDDVLGTKVDAGRLQAALADRLGRDRARPARHRPRTPSTTFKTGIFPTTTARDRRASSATPTTTRAAPRPRPACRSRRSCRRAVHRLHARGEDPARRPARGGRPAAPRAEHLHLRLRHAGPDRPDAARLVDRTAASRATRTAGATRRCRATRRRPAGRRRRRRR